MSFYASNINEEWAATWLSFWCISILAEMMVCPLSASGLPWFSGKPLKEDWRQFTRNLQCFISVGISTWYAILIVSSIVRKKPKETWYKLFPDAGNPHSQVVGWHYNILGVTNTKKGEGKHCLAKYFISQISSPLTSLKVKVLPQIVGRWPKGNQQKKKWWIQTFA